MQGENIVKIIYECVNDLNYFAERRKIKFNLEILTIVLSKSIGPKGDVKLRINTPIIFPIIPSKGKIIHIPTINSATRNCIPKKLNA